VAENPFMLQRFQIIAAACATCCLLAAVGVLAQSASDDTRSRENQLIALERLWNEAQVNRDANALAGMIGDKFVNTEWDGEVSERGKFLADIADPRFKVTSLNIQDLKVVLYNNAAVVAGIYHTKGTYLGKPYEHTGRFTDTWVLQDARWQCVASHTSLLQK
jgi:ketosteroid isomerase-like protein